MEAGSRNQAPGAKARHGWTLFFIWALTLGSAEIALGKGNDLPTR